MDNRFDQYGALWLLCTHWHTGQWSRGYRILSKLVRIGYRPGRGLQEGTFETDQQRDYYHKYYRLKNTL